MTDDLEDDGFLTLYPHCPDNRKDRQMTEEDTAPQLGGNLAHMEPRQIKTITQFITNQYNDLLGCYSPHQHRVRHAKESHYYRLHGVKETQLD